MSKTVLKAESITTGPQPGSGKDFTREDTIVFPYATNDIRRRFLLSHMGYRSQHGGEQNPWGIVQSQTINRLNLPRKLAEGPIVQHALNGGEKWTAAMTVSAYMRHRLRELLTQDTAEVALSLGTSVVLAQRGDESTRAEFAEILGEDFVPPIIEVADQPEIDEIRRDGDELIRLASEIPEDYLDLLQLLAGEHQRLDLAHASKQ